MNKINNLGTTYNNLQTRVDKKAKKETSNSEVSDSVVLQKGGDEEGIYSGKGSYLSKGKHNVASNNQVNKGKEVKGTGVNGSTQILDTFHERLAAIFSDCTWCDISSAGINVMSNPLPNLTLSETTEIDKRVTELASDPAKGNKITPGTIEEAVIAIVAEKGGIIEGPVTRETTGLAEFVDLKGQTWDVKSPLSPPDGKWVFDANHQIEKIRHDLSQGDRTLLNLSRCNKEDTITLLKLLNTELTASEFSLISVLVNYKEA